MAAAQALSESQPDVALECPADTIYGHNLPGYSRLLSLLLSGVEGHILSAPAFRKFVLQLPTLDAGTAFAYRLAR
jgi:hypothetical protein